MTRCMKRHLIQTSPATTTGQASGMVAVPPRVVKVMATAIVVMATATNQEARPPLPI